MHWEVGLAQRPQHVEVRNRKVCLTFDKGAFIRLRQISLDTKGATFTRADANRKTGSGLLVDSSVTDDWGASLGARRESSTNISHSQGRYAETRPAVHDKDVNYVPSHNNSARNTSSYGLPPRAINLNTSQGTATGGTPKPNFGSNFTNPLMVGSSEQAPTVYTKFDRPVQPTSFRQADSEHSSRTNASNSHSPVDERSSMNMSRVPPFPSLPTSRNSSMPPSRHSDGPPPDFSNARVAGLDSYQRPSPANATQQQVHIGTNFVPYEQQIYPQFGQMTLDNDRRIHTSQMANMPNGAFSTGVTSTRDYVPPVRQISLSRPRSSDAHEHEPSQLTTFIARAQPSLHLPNPFTGYDIYQSSDDQYVNDSNGRRKSSNSPTADRRDSGHSPDNAQFQYYSNAQSAAFMNQKVGNYQPFINDPRIDPRMAQMIANQLRMQYGNFYPYGNGQLQPMNGMPPYLQMPPMTLMPAVEAPRAPRSDVEPGNSLMSVLLVEFKSNNNKNSRRYELKVGFSKCTNEPVHLLTRV